MWHRVWNMPGQVLYKIAHKEEDLEKFDGCHAIEYEHVFNGKSYPRFLNFTGATDIQPLIDMWSGGGAADKCAESYYRIMRVLY